MSTKSKASGDREAARRVAETMYAALQRLPKNERTAALKDIQNIRIIPNRRTSKRSKKLALTEGL
jgi:hypothetical protein